MANFGARLGLDHYVGANSHIEEAVARAESLVVQTRESDVIDGGMYVSEIHAISLRCQLSPESRYQLTLENALTRATGEPRIRRRLRDIAKVFRVIDAAVRREDNELAGKSWLFTSPRAKLGRTCSDSYERL